MIASVSALRTLSVPVIGSSRAKRGRHHGNSGGDEGGIPLRAPSSNRSQVSSVNEESSLSSSQAPLEQRTSRRNTSQHQNQHQHQNQQGSASSLNHPFEQQQSVTSIIQGEPVQEEEETTEGGLLGWTVVAGSSIIFLVTLGLIYTFGVLQAELLKRRFTTASTLGWVSSTTVVIAPLFALPITTLIRYTSNRFVALLGAACTGLGYVATSYTFDTDSSVAYLFLAQTLFGCGYAFNFWACNSLAGEYFTRKRALAIGIVYAGSGLGGAIFSLGLSRLISSVGLEKGVRIMGFIALAILIPASLTLQRKGETKIPKFRFAYFKQVNFNLMLFATGFMTFSLFVPPFYLPSYAVTAGLSSETGTYLVAGYNLASFVGRILFGLLADSRVGPLTSLCLAMVLMAISILTLWIASSGLMAPLIIFLLINGAASGALLNLQPPALASMYGVAEMASTMAIVTMSRAAGSAFGAPIAGILLDAFGGPHSDIKAYTYPLLVMGLISLVAASALLILRYRLGGLDLKKRV